MTKKLCALGVGCALLMLLGAWPVRADQVEMQNGDRYIGKVLSLTPDTVIIQSEVLGKVKLPRDKVAAVNFGTNATVQLAAQAATRPILTNSSVRGASAPAAGDNVENASVFRHLAAHTNLIQHVEDQFLKEAGPEAKAKFDEMLGSLMNGKLDMNGLRAQASEAVNELKALKGDAGEQGAGMLDGYQAILEKFLKESAPPPGSTVTNAPTASHAATPPPDTD